MRYLYVVLACMALAMVACRQNDQCIDKLATRVIESATRGDYLPESLLGRHEGRTQDEQLALARRISIANLFSADDFVFSTRQMTPGTLMKRGRAGLSYSVNPTHEILIYNKKWPPYDVPVLCVDVVNDHRGCYIAVPRLKTEKFEEMNTFYERLFVQVDELSRTLTQDQKAELLSLFKSSDNYEYGLKSVVEATGADENVALFLLSQIANPDGVRSND